MEDILWAFVEEKDPELLPTPVLDIVCTNLLPNAKVCFIVTPQLQHKPPKTNSPSITEGRQRHGTEPARPPRQDTGAENGAGMPCVVCVLNPHSHTFSFSSSRQYFDNLLGLGEDGEDHPLHDHAYKLIEALCRIDTDLVTRIIPQLEHHINVN